MQKRVLVLTTSAFFLACGAIAASAQQEPPTQQPQILQQQQEQERQLQGAQTPRRAVHDDIEDDAGMMGSGYGPGWRHHQGWGRGVGMMGRGGMMGPGSMHSGMMMRMLFAMMDSDGDGAVSLQEFQAAHERIFKAMDANKDGRLTLEEIQGFMQGARGSVPRQYALSVRSFYNDPSLRDPVANREQRRRKEILAAKLNKTASVALST
jgi:hypothetical protein